MVAQRAVPALMVLGMVVGACAGDDPATAPSGPSEPRVDTTLDARPVDTIVPVSETMLPATSTDTTTTTTTAAAPVTTAPSEVSTTAITTAPDPATTTTVDDRDIYFPIEYAPGFRLRVTEPAPCDGAPRPALVSANSYIAPDLVGRGFVVVALLTDGPAVRQFDAQFLQDIADVSDRVGIAVQWLRAHAEEYCVAPDAIAVTGYSYGALAVFALAYSDGDIEAGDLVVVDEAGPPVVSETKHVSPPTVLAAFSNDPDAVVAHAGFAIADTIDPGEPPLLMFNGRNDPLIPFVLAEHTCAAALAVDIVCEFVAHDEGHAFSEDDREALDLVTDFLEREMVEPAGLSLEN